MVGGSFHEFEREVVKVRCRRRVIGTRASQGLAGVLFFEATAVGVSEQVAGEQRGDEWEQGDVPEEVEGAVNRERDQSTHYPDPSAVGCRLDR